MTHGFGSDWRMNRRQMILMSGAACGCGLVGKNAFAAGGKRFPLCLELEPWYAGELSRSQTPNAPTNPKAAGLTQTELIQRSLNHITNAGSPSLSVSHPAFRGLNSTRQEFASRAISETLKLAKGDTIPKPYRAIMQRTKLWAKNSKIKYGFVSDGDGNLVSFIREAFKDWMELTCLTIEEEKANPDAADIRISFIADRGHYSNIGTDSKLQEASLNSSGRFESMNLDPTGLDNLNYMRGVAKHETGHSIGFAHEHQNPDHPIIWDEDLVRTEFAQSQGWDNQKIFENILEKLSDTNQYVFTPRDGKSIMHYSFPPELIRNANGADVPTPENPNVVLSPVDKDFARKQYGCSGADGDAKDTENKGQETATAIKSERQQLSAESAQLLESKKLVKREIAADAQMHLYKIEDVEGDYIIETVDGARVGKALSGAMPVVVELFNGTDFAEDKSIQTSTFGAFNDSDKNTKLTSIGVLDAFLPCNLKKGTKYYALVRPQQRLKAGEKGSYTLYFRPAGTDHEHSGVWGKLRNEIKNNLNTILKSQSELGNATTGGSLRSKLRQ